MSAQEDGHSIEITLMAGFHFTSRLDFVEGDFKMGTEFSYGAILAYEVTRDLYAEFHFTRSNTEGNFFPLGLGIFPELYEMNINYLLLGDMKEIDAGVDGEVILFFNVGFGAVNDEPKNDNLKGT